MARDVTLITALVIMKAEANKSVLFPSLQLEQETCRGGSQLPQQLCINTVEQHSGDADSHRVAKLNEWFHHLWSLPAPRAVFKYGRHQTQLSHAALDYPTSYI